MTNKNVLYKKKEKETRNILNKQLNLTPKAIRERRKKNPKDRRMKEIIKI